MYSFSTLFKSLFLYMTCIIILWDALSKVHSYNVGVTLYHTSVSLSINVNMVSNKVALLALLFVRIETAHVRVLW